MVFHWSLSDSESPQVSRFIFSILADLNNAVVWMVSTCHLNSKSSCPIINPLVTVSLQLVTVPLQLVKMSFSYSIVFFSIPLEGGGIYPFFTFFQFYSMVSRDSRVNVSFESFFFTLELADVFFTSYQVSRTLHSILLDLSNSIVWLVSTYPLISNSSGPFTNLLGIVSSAIITMVITVTFWLHSLLVF